MKTFGKILLASLILTSVSSNASALSLNVNPEGEITARDFLVKETPVVIEIPSHIVSSIASSRSIPEPAFFKNTAASFSDYIKPSKETADFKALTDFVRLSVLPKFKTRAPQDAKWAETDGRVTEFQPDIPGLAADPVAILKTITDNIRAGSSTVNLNPVSIPSSVKLADLNNRGITSLVARGSSDFHGSSANRIKNIQVGVSRFKGLIIPAGQTFSFNDPLGPVDGEHGFAPELVIKYNGVFPEFGGGICQVSTTVFRTALNGGFPVTERRNHSFAVKYYTPQGTDATIYPGVQDLKFLNDTPGDILIWAKIEGTFLYFDFYGTPDNRQVEIGSPVKYDVKSTGAFKTTLSRTVRYASGDEKKDTFTSNYRPEAEFTRTTTAVEPPVEAPKPEPETPEETQA